MSVVFWLYIALFSVSGFGLISIQHQWKNKLEIQYKLDACVSQTGETLTQILNLIENSAIRQTGYRLALAAFQATPAAPAAQALRGLILAESILQKTKTTEWNYIRTRWNTWSYCNKGVLGKPIQGHGFVWPLPDSLGPQPPKRSLPGIAEKKRYELFLIDRNRTARFQIIQQKSRGIFRQWRNYFGQQRTGIS